MLKKILIANRGEIVLRIIRACKEMGIRSVALCPQKGEEQHFLETKLADEYYFLEEEGILGYLDQRRILEIAKKAKVDAVHPGYGFLAENGDFAEFCQRNGIKFIGPAPDVLRKLGNKIEARKIARRVGLPMLPAYEIPLRNERECRVAARQIGLPFLLKAADGGGGIGIKIIDKDNYKDLLSVFQKLKREVKNAFGSEEIFAEKYLIRPRHIEFQILGDGKGKVVHFGERECSIQRRHQKLIEEAPSPFIDRKTRERMGNLAVKLGEYLKYESLGTIEFLVDENKKFYFMEVNPRLQVEHPVTELTTGFDLVKEQIKIAGGDRLEIRQKSIKFSNWAMEFRINAEDAFLNFQPQQGVVNRYFPPGGKGVEIHSFCQPDQKIFPYFDSLISKLVIFGKDREEAIKRAKRVLDEYIIEGIPNLIPFYKVLIDNENFIKGKFSTSFIKDNEIVETFKKKYPKPQPRAEEKMGEISEEELAKLVVKLYLQLKKENEVPQFQNRWKMFTRLTDFEK